MGIEPRDCSSEVDEDSMFGRRLIRKLKDRIHGQIPQDGLGCLSASKHRGDLGQAMVETAMVIMVLMLLLLAIFDLGRAVVIYSSMTAAAQDAAHMGALTSNTGLIQTAALDRLILADPAQTTVTVVRTATHTTVTLDFSFQPITPMIAVFTGDGIPLTQSAQVAILGTVVSP